MAVENDALVQAVLRHSFFMATLVKHAKFVLILQLRFLELLVCSVMGVRVRLYAEACAKGVNIKLGPRNAKLSPLLYLRDFTRLHTQSKRHVLRP